MVGNPGDEMYDELEDSIGEAILEGDRMSRMYNSMTRWRRFKSWWKLFIGQHGYGIWF